MEKPCTYSPAAADPTDPTAIVVVVENNKCARLIRERYVELQDWIRGRVQ